MRFAQIRARLNKSVPRQMLGLHSPSSYRRQRLRRTVVPTCERYRPQRQSPMTSDRAGEHELISARAFLLPATNHAEVERVK